MGRSLAGWTLLAIAACSLAFTGCKKEGCLGGQPGCRMPSPCAKVSFTCDGGSLEVRTLGPKDARPGGLKALGAAGDVLIGNDQIVAVVSAPGNQNYVDVAGGSLLDLGVRGQDDDFITEVLQTTGILPRDEADYTSVELIDERPTRVALQLHGTLYTQPNVPIHTLYEVRPCEPGVRIRTEIFNGSPDPQLWALSDGFYWSKRSPLPFTPGVGAGFDHPSFDLLSINDAFQTFPYLGASGHAAPYASYSYVGCNQNLLEGFQSEVVSSAGPPRSVVESRDYRIYERFLAVTASPDIAASANVALGLRSQLWGDRLVTLSGRLARTGAPFGDERSASVLISQGTAATDPTRRVPWSQVVPDATGAFSARVPAGKDYHLEVDAFGEKVVEQDALAVGADTDVGTLTLPSTAHLHFSVIDAATGSPINAEVFVVPADDATRQAVAGTFHGQYTSCSPWLGPPPGSSPACNRVLVQTGVAQADMPAPPAPANNFFFYAFHGPFWTIARQTMAITPGSQTVELALQALPLQPAGTLAGDFHVHGHASFDSSLPDFDRVLSFAATDLQVIVATDHDVAWDYSQVIQQLGLQGSMVSQIGVETTGHVPFLYVPGNPYPLVIGHYNFWPIAYDPSAARNGAPFDEYAEPGELMDRFEQPKQLYTGTWIIELNHPWAAAEFGRDLGFPRAIGVDALIDLPRFDDGTDQGVFVRRPAGNHANSDHLAQEVMNGTNNQDLPAHRAFWFYVLNEGLLRTGTANSDSHSLTDNTVGVPRNLVSSGTTLASFDPNAFNQSIRDGAVLGTNGPVIEATLDGPNGPLPYGLAPVTPPAGAKLHIRVSAAPWVPVTEVRFIVNGKVVETVTGSALGTPMDPFGTTGLVRFSGDVPLSDLGLTPGSHDAWVVIEAGTPLPVVCDLGGGPVSGRYPHGAPDGIPDTSDNDGDGVCDRSDVAPGKDTGPLNIPPSPTTDSDPLFHFAQVVTDGFPFAFTNPFVLDMDGNGQFDPPGVGGTAP